MNSHEAKETVSATSWTEDVKCGSTFCLIFFQPPDCEAIPTRAHVGLRHHQYQSYAGEVPLLTLDCVCPSEFSSAIQRLHKELDRVEAKGLKRFDERDERRSALRKAEQARNASFSTPGRCQQV